MRNALLLSLSTISHKALTFFTLTMASNTAFAVQQNLSTILSEQAAAYVESNIVVDDDVDLRVIPTNIDNRINIPKCPDLFEFTSSEASLRQSNVSVKITCPANDWYLFTSIKVAKTKPVVVVSDVLSPGSLLSADNLELVDTDITKLRSSTFSFIEDIEGARLKRRVRPGQIVTRSMLCFVCKGDRITLHASTAGLKLKTFGIAQQDGNLGDTIRVKNSNSSKIVSGIVESTGEVKIAF